MLKNIPALLSPDLLQVLAAMGHGDDIAIVDANFPASSHAQRLIRLDGSDSEQALDAILQLMPVDTFCEDPLRIMLNQNGEAEEICQAYAALASRSEGRSVELSGLSRDDFYQQARAAYCIVATSEQRLYGNCLLRKGVVESSEHLA